MPAANDLDIALLIKMMGMTGSDNPNQVLVAIRKANELLVRANADWESLLRGKVTVIADPFSGADAVSVPKAANGWKPQTTSRPAPPPPPRPKPQAPPPRPASPPPPPPKPQPLRKSAHAPLRDRLESEQTAIVNYASRGGEWVLNSNERLDVWDWVVVIRKDGQKKVERVGSFIEDKNARFYYNVQGKTSQVGAGGLVV